ncbi:MAG: GHKL domain-containing protein, partial [Vicingus serpentipes]|nr:GHKL domain-containing protein [Vicingus serpentipes]
ECYPSKLNQLFMNIMDNAIQAIAAKNTTNQNEINVKTYVENNNVVLVVKDSGIGMNQETKEKIFEPFYTTKPVGEGTGLGMSIAYSIIKVHNASIEINSKENIGTEIIIKIPFNNG